MSGHWPEQQGYGSDPRQQGFQPNTGGYQAPPGYQTGGQASSYQAPQYPPPYPMQYQQPWTAPPAGASGSTIAALIVAVVTMLICGGTNIVGVILAAIALSKTREPEEAAKLTRYAWVSNWIHIGVIVLLIALFIFLVVLAETS